MKTIKIEHLSSDTLKQIADMYLKEYYATKRDAEKLHGATRLEMIRAADALIKEHDRIRDYLDK